MDSRLMADRHPVLGRLYRLWLARGDGTAMPLAENIAGRLADLDDVTAMIQRPTESGEMPRIERSGRVVDRIFGVALAGEPIGRLTPSSDHAENEAALVFASGRTLMMEDQVELPGGPARIARLYLPLADAHGEVTAIMVGVAKVA
ncbi:hypothetical protein [Kumtagia ephedrae]|uniref:PAS domain-containing protein n=1 Tax=Kumtagia ephedrae TaxID=2116701 RepID=A0A2P7S0Y1_9HYPH|nr:hypothetical protein [Mesorhizobium ephedrae]PSJ56127.1 hypothetical protein C7I84_21380 [Mesorhizobium ephedrae]